MAGGQERILRRRIRSVQSTRKITKAMELIAASRIVRAQNRIAANRPFREGMERGAAAHRGGRSQAAAKLLGTPESPRHVGVLAIVGDRGLAGSYNSGVLRATERLVAEYRADGVEVTVWSVGKKAPSYFRYRGIEAAAVVRRLRRPPRLLRRPPRRRRRGGAVRGRRDRPGRDGLDPVHLGGHPAGGAHADAAPARCPSADAGGGTRPARTRRSRATPSSSRSPRSCWSSWRRGRSRRRSSPPCSRGRPRSSRPSSGPWRPPPRTRTSWSAP